jgi:hypothetical protein
MPNFNGDSRLEASIAMRDDYLVELEVRLVTPTWRGIGRGYSTIEELRTFASDLVAFSRNSTIPVTFATDYKDGVSDLVISFTEYDISGQVACRVDLRDRRSQPSNSTAPFELSASFFTEPTAIDRFSRQLMAMLANNNQTATLPGN